MNTPEQFTQEIQSMKSLLTDLSNALHQTLAEVQRAGAAAITARQNIDVALDQGDERAFGQNMTAIRKNKQAARETSESIRQYGPQLQDIKTRHAKLKPLYQELLSAAETEATAVAKRLEGVRALWPQAQNLLGEISGIERACDDAINSI